MPGLCYNTLCPCALSSERRALNAYFEATGITAEQLLADPAALKRLLDVSARPSWPPWNTRLAI